MKSARAKLDAWHCLRCGYVWPIRRRDEHGGPIQPKNCPNPKCNSPYWNKPRRQKRGPKVK